MKGFVMHKGRVFPRGRMTRSVFGMLLTLLVSGVSLISLLSPTKPANAADISGSYTWKPVKIGGGGFVTGLIFHPNVSGLIYIRTDVGGAYRWEPSSQSWTQLLLAQNVSNPTNEDYHVESMAIDENNNDVLYLAGGLNWNYAEEAADGRILKSTNRGGTWTELTSKRWKMNGNGEERQGAERLAVDPNNPNILYFGSRVEGLWVSTDGGSNWNQVGQIPTAIDPGVKFVHFDPSAGTVNGKTRRIYVGVMGHGVYRSDDAGASWTRVLESLQAPYDISVASNGTAYVSIHNKSAWSGWVYRSDTNGNNWQDITPINDENAYHIAIDPFNEQRIILASGGLRDGRIWRSGNGGSSWTALDVRMASADSKWILNTDEDNWLSTARMLFNPHVPNDLWFAQGMGFWRSSDLSDNEVDLHMISKGIEEMVANDIAAPPGANRIFLTEDRNGFSKSLSEIDEYPERTILTPRFSAGTSVDYSGGDPNFIAVVSSDTRWINEGLSGYSTDGGQTWNQFAGGDGNTVLYGGNIAVSATNTNNLVWLPTNSGVPHYTTDRGATWNPVNYFDNIGGKHIMIWWEEHRALAADYVDGGNFYIYLTNNGGEFYRSSNGGQTWEKAPGQAPSSMNDVHVWGQIRAVPGKAGHVWASTVQGGLHYTTNKGNSWTQVSGVQEAKSFGFGKAMNGSTYPAIYIHGKVNGTWGVWRSTDQGANWDLTSQYPAGIYDNIGVVMGDMDVEGRVYVGFSGDSFVYGDAGGSQPTPTPTQNPGGNLALNAPVTASSIQDNDQQYAASNAVDGNSGTRWSSQVSDNQWLRIDLGSTKSISRIKLNWEVAYGSGYRIEVSNDGSNWTSIYSTTSGDGGIDDLTGLSGSGRYIRLVGTARGTIWGYSLWDFEVYGSGGTGGTVTLNATEDRDDYASSLGNDPNVHTSQWQTTYLKFNLSSVGSNVSNAKLRVYRPNTDNGTVTFTAYQGNGDSWSENNNSSLPGTGSQIITATSSSVGWVEFDVTSFVASQKSGDGVVTIALKSTSSTWTGVHSKDNGSNKPELVVTSS